MESHMEELGRVAEEVGDLFSKWFLAFKCLVYLSLDQCSFNRPDKDFLQGVMTPAILILLVFSVEGEDFEHGKSAITRIFLGSSY